MSHLFQSSGGNDFQPLLAWDAKGEMLRTRFRAIQPFPQFLRAQFNKKYYTASKVQKAAEAKNIGCDAKSR